ncbi:hypothetical protein EDEG_03101 [Edhazardia aedis USNM 41457]|uniref:Uncharacterized protein n=1 Tax=Edhazardia aedis (strain USNM 41457) TaxID=1003232 RepID=J9D3T1_EDHAE|nr:hypothetical protein EDEG_03101 [Edhazardia aedis USNM 41457]|eukprot:EJW02481.1 hypothetical protein EDEG_03101 [Edhazardia aedis USNM 41457]
MQLLKCSIIYNNTNGVYTNEYFHDISETFNGQSHLYSNHQNSFSVEQSTNNNHLTAPQAQETTNQQQYQNPHYNIFQINHILPQSSHNSLTIANNQPFYGLLQQHIFYQNSVNWQGLQSIETGINQLQQLPYIQESAINPISRNSPLTYNHVKPLQYVQQQKDLLLPQNLRLIDYQLQLHKNNQQTSLFQEYRPIYLMLPENLLPRFIQIQEPQYNYQQQNVKIPENPHLSLYSSESSASSPSSNNFQQNFCQPKPSSYYQQTISVPLQQEYEPNMHQLPLIPVIQLPISLQPSEISKQVYNQPQPSQTAHQIVNSQFSENPRTQVNQTEKVPTSDIQSTIHDSNKQYKHFNKKNITGCQPKTLLSELNILSKSEDYISQQLQQSDLQQSHEKEQESEYISDMQTSNSNLSQSKFSFAKEKTNSTTTIQNNEHSYTSKENNATSSYNTVSIKEIFLKKIECKKDYCNIFNILRLKKKLNTNINRKNRWKTVFLCEIKYNVLFSSREDEIEMSNLVDKFIIKHEDEMKFDLEVCAKQNKKDKIIFLDFLRHNIITLNAHRNLINVNLIDILLYLQRNDIEWFPTNEENPPIYLQKIFLDDPEFYYNVPYEKSDFIIYSRRNSPQNKIAIHITAKILSKDIFWEDGVLIGENCEIHDNICFGENVTIVKDTIIYSNCYLDKGTFFGFNCSIGDNTYIGKNTILRQNIVIGKNNSTEKILKAYQFGLRYPIPKVDLLFKKSIFHTIIDEQNIFDTDCTIKPLVIIMPRNIFSLGFYLGELSFIDSGNKFLKFIKIPNGFLAIRYKHETVFFKMLTNSKVNFYYPTNKTNGHFCYIVCTFDFISEKVRKRILKQVCYKIKKLNQIPKKL